MNGRSGKARSISWTRGSVDIGFDTSAGALDPLLTTGSARAGTVPGIGTEDVTVPPERFPRTNKGEPHVGRCRWSDSAPHRLADTTDQDSSASSARRAPLADAVQPVAHETRDRIITGLAHRGPVPGAGLRRLAALRAAAALERPRRLRAHLHPDRARDHGRLPPPLHPSQLQDEARGPRRDRRPRLGGDRGAGDLLGRRPPQAPRLLRPGGRPAQPARRPRRGRLGPVQGLLPRPPRLALHPHPARLQGPASRRTC